MWIIFDYSNDYSLYKSHKKIQRCKLTSSKNSIDRLNDDKKANFAKLYIKSTCYIGLKYPLLLHWSNNLELCGQLILNVDKSICFYCAE